MKQENSFLGYVLHRRPYRETSYLVDFFTLEQGCIRAVARGVKNSKSDKKSLLQPFQPLHVSFTGKGELQNLKRVESAGPTLMLVGKPMFCAMYLNELVTRLLPSGMASDSVFHAYQNALQAMYANEDMEWVLRQFEFCLFDELGVLPDFSTDAQSSEPLNENSHYVLIPEVGFTEFHPNMSKLQLFPGRILIALADGELTPQTKKVAKVLVRLLLAPLIGNKPLKSRELFS